jgi:hypothetical protein
MFRALRYTPIRYKKALSQKVYFVIGNINTFAPSKCLKMVINIDFEDTYEIISTVSDYTEATFYTFDRSSKPVLIKILLIPVDNPLLPGVHNLAFGPPTKDGSIDDKARIKHKDVNRVFSTILLFCLNFLQENPSGIIGLDGSDDTRTHLYHRIFITNKNYLLEYFVALGADWCVRYLRNGKCEIDHNGEPLIRLRPELFDYQRNTKDLYSYYMFHLVKRTK